MSKPTATITPPAVDIETDAANPQRWTAKRKAALVIDILPGKTTAAETARYVCRKIILQRSGADRPAASPADHRGAARHAGTQQGRAWIAGLHAHGQILPSFLRPCSEAARGKIPLRR